MKTAPEGGSESIWEDKGAKFTYLFYFLWPHLEHVEIPGPGIESEPQLWQHQIL